ncbi:hypothetical protein [Intrasporangium sp.]|uniref:hypothetical protein n=1 Tax=Intrasporangium sp. TaxID=1925024 RepID=UPI00322171AF
MRGRWVGLAALALVTAGCAPGATTLTDGGTAGAESSRESVESVEAVAGSVESTLVLEAVVQPSAPVTVTARAAGRYSLVDENLRLSSGGSRSQAVALPTGIVVDELTVSSASEVPVNHPVARGHTRGFALVAKVPASALYRLYSPPRGARGQIDKGPGPFACILVDPVPQPGDGEATLTCAVPDSVHVYAGMPGLLSVRTGFARDVVVLPLEAIAGDASSGTVLVLRPGRAPEEREVHLGVSDGSRIAVLSGLRAGETVRVPGPDLGGRS